jgi:ubiquinone/menaquinone biosynthesis C-methylase UbiE
MEIIMSDTANPKDYNVWRLPEMVKKYLSGSRAAFPGSVLQFEVMLKLLKENSCNVKNVLDIGCGDGILGAIVLDTFPEARGVFLDFSDDMLTAAKKNMAQISHRIDLINSDYSVKKWVDNVNSYAPYDVIVSGYSIHHQNDSRKKEIFNEIYGLLDEGGIFINVEHVLSRSKWIERTHNEYFIDSLYEYSLSKGSSKNRGDISKGFYNRIDMESNILAFVEDQCNWLREIGFIDVDCYFKIFEMAIFGGRKL